MNKHMVAGIALICLFILEWIYLIRDIKSKKIHRLKEPTSNNYGGKLLNLGMDRHENFTAPNHPKTYWMIIIGNVFVSILMLVGALFLFFGNKFF